jgi:hypothetical protein
MSNTLYNVYINESGDEGIKRGCKWFVISALIVDCDYDSILSNKVVNIKNKLNISRKKELRWSNISKMNYVVEEIKNEPFTIIHLVVNTDDIKFNKDIDLYSYFISYLLERVSHFINEKRSIAKIFISKRNEFNLTKQNLLIIELTNKRHYHNINQYTLRSIEFIDSNKRNLLQLTKICCNSLSKYLTYEKEETFNLVLLLKDKLRKKHNEIIGHGIKIFPNLESGNIVNKLI